MSPRSSSWSPPAWSPPPPRGAPSPPPVQELPLDQPLVLRGTRWPELESLCQLDLDLLTQALRLFREQNRGHGGGEARGATLWAWDQMPLVHLAWLRDEMLLTLYAALLWSHVREEQRVDSSMRAAWGQLLQCGLSRPSWAWGLVGRDSNLDDGGLRWGPGGSIEAHLLLDGGGEGVDPLDDPLWLASVDPGASRAWSDSEPPLVLRVALDAHGNVEGATMQPEGEASAHESNLLVPRAAWSLLQSAEACRDQEQAWRINLRMALRQARAELVSV